MRFRVHGLPAPQGSKRHVGGGRMVESSRAVGPWREAVRAEAQRVCETEVPGPILWQVSPLSVTIVFVLPRPKSHWRTARNLPHSVVRPSAPRFPAGRPDLDKLARATLDGLVMGGMMADDAQVCRLEVIKAYAVDGDAPGAIIDVEAMT